MSVEREWIVWLPGLVPGFNLAARAFGMAQGEVLTSTPVYPPFLRCGEHNGHRTEGVPLQQVGDTWTIDFDALEAAITPNTYMFLLCSPHNPTGRLWRRSELEKLADFCLRHELIICSDEIHCDLLLEESRPHIPTCSLGDEVADRTVTLMAPSKTFNVAGLNCSFAVISNAALRSRYRTAMAGLVSFVNALGYTAALAAYRDGEEWLSQVLGCLRENHAYTYDRIKGIPGLGMTRVEATYLAWIDARALGTDDPFKLFVEHGVALSDGKQFGMPGFVRLNFACPHSILAEALDRMEHAARCARGDVL
jgi:cystathionine beta-lyase